MGGVHQELGEAELLVNRQTSKSSKYRT